MQKIVPNLWFAGDAKEAVEYYTSVFTDTNVLETKYYPEEGLADFQKDMAGKPLVIEFELHGCHFTAINADDTFTPNPSVSFMLNFDPSQDEQAAEHLDELWHKLADGGTVLMELGEYPYSKRYGWVQDKFGYSWQLMLTDPTGEPRPFIIPSLLFSGPVQNQAQQAVDYYVSIFKDARRGNTALYTDKQGAADAGALMFGDFTLADQWFAAMDSGIEQRQTFSPALSFVVMCKDQEEIDYFWSKLSAVPEAEQCGWCQDQFGVSWQIVPHNINELVDRPGGFEKMSAMHKLIIDEF